MATCARVSLISSFVAGRVTGKEIEGRHSDSWPGETEGARRGGGAARTSQPWAHRPNAVTNWYNIAVTVTVSISGGCITTPAPAVRM